MEATPKTYDILIDYLEKAPSVISMILGGSRSRNNAKPDSDYDLFIVVNSNQFEEISNTISYELEKNISEFIFIGKDKYLEDWGYMYCGIDNKGVFYDLALIPLSRINEMCLRTHNIILFDKSGLIAPKIESSKDINYQSEEYLENKLPEVIRMVYINYVRYIRNYKKKDYWMSFRFLNLLRENIMKCERIRKNTPSKLFFLSDENFEMETQNHTLKNDFIIDGTFEMLNNSARKIISSYKNIFPNDTVIDKIDAIHQFKL
jgi:predicted nucleotidyltransferase